MSFINLKLKLILNLSFGDNVGLATDDNLNLFGTLTRDEYLISEKLVLIFKLHFSKFLIWDHARYQKKKKQIVEK